MARGVDYVDRGTFPYYVGCRRCNSDSSLTLQFHGVHGGTYTILSMHLVDCVYLVAIEEDTLRKSCLSGIDMRADTDVS